MKDFYRQKGAGQGSNTSKTVIFSTRLGQGHFPLRKAGVYQADDLSSADKVIPH